MIRCWVLFVALMPGFAGDLEELAWMAGTWRGQLGESTTIEEVWSDPAGGTMMGMFRLLKGGEPGFTQFITLERTADGVMLRLRHFHPGLLGWEAADAPVVYRLETNDGNQAVFVKTDKPLPYRLIYRRDGSEGLVVVLDQETSRQEFRYRRVRFERHVVDTSGLVDIWLKAVGDLNGDGRVDLVAGCRREGGLVWYQNPDWRKHRIAEGKFSTDGEVVDIDGDGDVDVLAVTAEPDGLVWFANPGWEAHQVGKVVLHDVEPADFDGDGDLDLVGRNQGAFGATGDKLHFYRQDSPTQWTHQALPIADGEGLSVADMDNDGDADVIVERVWYENTGDPMATRWPGHEYGPGWEHPFTFVATGDINGDGRRDVVLAPSEKAGGSYRISWFEAREGSWAEHVVEEPVETVHHFIGVADFDGDGAADIATAAMEQGADPDEVTIFLNAAGGESWKKLVLSETASHSMRIADIDGDGDMDLYGANWRGRSVEWWENRLR